MTAAANHPAFNPNHLDELAITQALARGEHSPVLAAFFGPAFAELSLLAQQALAIAVPKHAPVVYLLPGLLGSKLGSHNRNGSEVLWLEPLPLVTGRLALLKIGKRRLRCLGVMLPGYLKLMLTLQAAGFHVKVHAYDWRRGIADLGQQFAAQLQQERSDEVMLVAHSMGALVARAALKQAAGAKVTRLVQLGPPNLGSFALVQVLRACYPTVRKLGAVDQTHSAEALTREVFSSFPSFYDMLPAAAQANGVNLFDGRQWPQDQLAPAVERLKLGRRLPRHLAAADRRCHVIAGVDQLTVCGVRRQDDEFVFQYHSAGDGTVALPLAAWPGAQHWHVREAHGQLPRSTPVCQATVELLHLGTTQHLSTSYQPDSPLLIEKTESELRAALNGKVRWEQLPLSERRDLLEPRISAAFAALCLPDSIAKV